MSQYYLKPNAIAEPLIDRWYAWSYLISPVTSALYFANSHLPLLDSFINAPQAHISALIDPAMRGGPFINHPVSCHSTIANLRDQLQQQHPELLALATAVKTLQKELQQASGSSLEPIYATLPDALQGYVELVYDLQHHASFRLFEALLYNSEFYKPQRQHICLSLEDVDQRDFVLSTPRLESPDRFEIALPFNHPGFDQLFAMRDRPQLLEPIMQTLGIPAENRSQFQKYFTLTAPQRSERPTSLRVRYFGHACILIETAQVTILCDPLVSYDNPSGLDRYSYQDLPEQIDYALITHNHQDHVMLETLLQLRHKIRTVVVPRNNPGSLVDPSLKLMLERIGFTSVMTLDEMESLTIPEGRITGLPVLGEHGDLNIASKLAYHIQIQNRSIVCAADSNNISPPLYAHIRRQLGAIDLLFIGMECEGAPYSWAYGALLPQTVPRSLAQTRRLNGSDASRAIELVKQLQPEQVYVYAMGQEPWLTFITSIDYQEDAKPLREADQLVNYCHHQGIVSERLYGRAEIYLEPRSQPRTIPQTTAVSQIAPKTDIPTMLSTADFLAKLQTMDVQLTVSLDSNPPNLRCHAPKGALDGPLKAELKLRKAEIIEFLQTRSHRDTFEQIRADALLLPNYQLSADYQPAQLSANQAVRQIFLTGATGFVGAFLLAELLNQTTVQIHCLIRSKTPEQGMQRLQKVLADYQLCDKQLWRSNYQSRLVIHCGDLSQPRLGLTPETWQNLGGQITEIYHNGAWVHHLLPYETLRPANVSSTKEILQLAAIGVQKVIHHISSSSVFVTAGISGDISEQQALDDHAMPQTGYAQTKWVSERLMAQAQAQGFAVNIYRLGGISGHSQTGIFNANDFLYRLLIGTVQLGCYPHDRPFPLRTLPIDYVTQAIVQLAAVPQTGQTYHLIHPHPVNADHIFQQLIKHHYPLKAIPYADWRNLVQTIAQTDSQHPLYPLLALLPNDRSDLSTNIPAAEFATDYTQTHLAAPPPPIDEKLLNVYISHLIQSRLIPPPPVLVTR
jgi:thioester reductase-like protein